MERTRHTRPGGTARPLGALAVLATAAGVLTWAAPGGPGPDGRTEVTGGPSASLYRSVAGAAGDAPGAVGTLLSLATEGTLVVLGLLLLWTGWTALRRRDVPALAAVLLAGAATVAAYAVSELLKEAVDEERPCRALRGVGTVDTCPPPGDWSFPSNHSTLAAALAVGVAAAR
ncbi:phosphatase PAP2 family protein, partial [Streptomyces mobaraensis]|uniref:phosphatase PAP2 family protein n=1 Tax=Streptomyces mobaraensis TaxID=35621 RepID=UPI0033263767